MSQSDLRIAPSGTDYPGKLLGIVGLIAAIVANVIGLVISAIAYSQSKKAGYKNTPALFGMIIGAALFVLWVIIGIISMIAGFAAAGMGY
jgi:hypothetical protein